MEFVCKSADATKALAKKISSKITGGQVLALTGQLGAGKTTFVQGLAKGLKIKEKIQSPTFVLLKEYSIGKNHRRMKFCHIDLYRIEKIQDIEELGLEDFLGKKDVICVIEWAEKIKNVLEKISAKIIWIEFEYIGENERKLKVKTKNEKGKTTRQNLKLLTF
ncbi:MAG: tRNA (adenosine(37)-N6)-threonylcarbamoyltransferase complex ATPase subunit type 1 TsaE [Candidatus Nealsonbacteria bacterium CG23_combo_of_CG06-09_8_20_14_all_40_13]|uniref:tRNA threonylcarbamoyladenosine biosynthesis protein TsaE n=1 Tax=Candidatus Nealsonbacteria bacterium CG23_combo_of_CG06-09_8_20_14_all_40_13 TaxID=1974724 RepID=A0A2G9YRG5_9BACT|nr:MAG: tRNA (adenosine(37)-N6)-threonylcarbamoyltransferase complex ATPase subunit type 1 TsaE [Candidatus Nealsonbacteria bacterium CG23_combo_of_CG06-09_8_20_14_all_40_13]PIR71217.1 MAG: tRNA (adenosine(37)-N6)-threonylcarbamoyltransferase complex ATPase subunit type 1 TsaE [Candidatus Nealsonbacteria bacterium CG10_big_fil_rev_8_21_14_0_10_40_24]PIU43165.1 MAG: tRNA (adenosine(37)-N6)-threonylcarbamoyltransferase complex ATPase subunit type 1 TsaE [Candidatus Nealsonbacteria bacterium CG07_la